MSLQSFIFYFSSWYSEVVESRNKSSLPFDDFPSFMVWAFSGLLQTLLIYCLPLILYFCLTNKKHTVKRIRIICAVYAASVWLLLLIVYTILEMSPPGVGPAVLWGYGANTLFAKWITKPVKSDPSSNDPPKEAPLEIKCAKCGSIIPPNAKFCPACGEKLPPPVPAGMTICPACGKMVAQSKYCPECGHKMEEYHPSAPVESNAPSCLHEDEKDNIILKPSPLQNASPVGTKNQANHQSSNHPDDIEKRIWVYILCGFAIIVFFIVGALASIYL